MPHCRAMKGFWTRVVTIAVGATVAATGCSTEPMELPGEQIVVVGDSYTTGFGGGGDSDAWPAMVWQSLREQGYDIDPIVSAESGAGYAYRGYRDSVFADKAKVIRRSTDLVVFFGSANDINAPVDEVPIAVRSTLEAAQCAAPQATLVVIGPAWPNADPPGEVRQVRDAVREQATAVGATFIDPLEQRWLWDDPGLIGPDNIHPNIAGQRYLADRIGPFVQSALSFSR